MERTVFLALVSYLELSGGRRWGLVAKIDSIISEAGADSDILLEVEGSNLV